MQDIDKWPALFQWLAAAGVFIGGIALTWFGTKRGKRPDNNDRPDDYDASREVMRADRARVIALETQLAENQMRRDWETALNKVAQSLADRFDKLDDRVRDLEYKIKDKGD